MLNRLSTTALGEQSPAGPALSRGGVTAAAGPALFRDGVTAVPDLVARAWREGAWLEGAWLEGAGLETDGLARACADPSAPPGEDVGAPL